jgi:hypothetical protein
VFHRAKIFTVFVHFPFLESRCEYLGRRFRFFSQKFDGVLFGRVLFEAFLMEGKSSLTCDYPLYFLFFVIVDWLP